MERRPLSLASAASQGVLWFLGQTATSRVLQFLAQILLAWLLSPDDFGQVSLALAVTTVVGALFSFGLEDVLLQRHRAIRLWTGTVFWLSLTIGLLGGLALLIVAPIAALIYHQPHLTGLISVAAIGAPIGALETIPGTILRSQLNFRALAIAQLGEAVAASALSIAFAAIGFGAYSLVLPSPIAAAARIYALWRIAKPKIRASRIRRRWKALLPSASASLGGRLLIIMMSQADYMILGLVANEMEVGIYYFAFKLAIQPLRILAGSLSAVLFPTLVQYRDDPAGQLAAALVVSQMLALVVMPACFLQAALASPALHLFFAVKWEGAERLIQLLSIGFAFDASAWAAGALLASRGEFRRSFFYTSLKAPIFLLLVGVGAVSRGALGAATAVASFYVIVQPIFCYVVFTRVGAIGWRDIARIYVLPVVFSAATVGGASLLSTSLQAPSWLQLCLVPMAALAMYVPIVRAFCPRPYRLLRDRVLSFRTRPVVS